MREQPRVASATIGLLLVTAVTGLILVFLATRDNLSYDSAWHVFIARQDSWDSFWREISNNAHPPLFYLALAAAVELFGGSLLAYRVVSIAAALAATWLLGRIIGCLTSNGWIGVFGAMAFGLSFTSIDVGLEVRAYTLASAFMLLAFAAYVEWVEAPAAYPSWKRVLFASATIVALLTHYATFFFIAAVLATPIVLAALDRGWRARFTDDVRAHPAGFVLMLLTPVVVAVVAYQLHAGRATALLGHVGPYLFDSARESLPLFLARTTGDLLVMFTPAFGVGRAAAVAMGLLSIGFCMVAVRRAGSTVAVVPFVLAGVMVALNVVTALAGRYPYGGELRHEFFLFPFLVVCLFTAVELVRRRLPEPWSAASLWSAAAGLAVGATSVVAIVSFYTSSIDPWPLFPRQIAKFRQTVEAPPAVLVDQFGLIIFLAHYDDWQWHRASEDIARRMWQVWDLRTGSSDLKVCRSRQWQLDLSSADTYQDLTDCFKQTGVSSVAIFSPQHPAFEPPWGGKDVQPLTRELASKEGLIPVRFLLDKDGAVGAFERAPSPK